MKSYYELLEVDENADKEVIKRAFYRLAKRFHPDVSDTQGDFLSILNAYETLRDERKRAFYNDALHREDLKRRKVLPPGRISFALSLQDLARMRIIRSGRTKHRTGCYKPKGYDVSVLLTLSELINGAMVYICVPAHVICPICGGNRVHCSLCSCTGQVLKAVPVPVAIPRALEDGDIFTVSMREIKSRKYVYFMIKFLSVKITLFKE
jgi:DnaJ-class molecular chaperone